MDANLRLALPVAILATLLPFPAGASAIEPGCGSLDARTCVRLGIAAMGGEAALRAVHGARIVLASNTLLVEQSYRQAPFLTAYDRTTESIDFDAQRVREADDDLWPESDPGLAPAQNSSDVIASPDGAVVKGTAADAAGPRSSIDDARARLSLGPERLLLTAEGAPDLHFVAPETTRESEHATVAFAWNGGEVRVLLNPWNHLPDAVETTRTFNDFWFAWGDVAQRVSFDDWKIVGALVYPTTTVVERNGTPWTSAQALDIAFNPPQVSDAFVMDPAATEQSARSAGWAKPFDASRLVALGPGIELYRGSWNVAVVRQDDGLLVIEAPRSSVFAAGAFAQARRDYPGLPIKALLTTSDSWPHVAGVREAVAQGIAVYGLDANRPLLSRLITAPHTLAPDDLQQHPASPAWHWVGSATELGTGSNRVVLIPLRGADTERQYMIYLPNQRLLYASDTLVLSEDQKRVYDPELTLEVLQAVKRNRLDVERVWAMHQAPVAWSLVEKLMAPHAVG